MDRNSPVWGVLRLVNHQKNEKKQFYYNNQRRKNTTDMSQFDLIKILRDRRMLKYLLYAKGKHLVGVDMVTKT